MNYEKFISNVRKKADLQEKQEALQKLEELGEWLKAAVQEYFDALEVAKSNPGSWDGVTLLEDALGGFSTVIRESSRPLLALGPHDEDREE